MLSWEEINKLANTDRRQYVEEWQYRKVYENTLPTIDNLYNYFLLWCLGKGYHNIAKFGANKAWTQFCTEIKTDESDTVIKKWIATIETSECAKDLQKYFNQKIKDTPPYVYIGE